MIKDAPLSFVIATTCLTGVAALTIWGIMEWHYGGIVANYESAIKVEEATIKQQKGTIDGQSTESERHLCVECHDLADKDKTVITFKGSSPHAALGIVSAPATSKFHIEFDNSSPFTEGYILDQSSGRCPITCYPPYHK